MVVIKNVEVKLVDVIVELGIDFEIIDFRKFDVLIDVFLVY